MIKMTTPLKKVSSVTILNISYDLAKNGDHYYLVEHKEPDAYDRPVARRVNLTEWLDVPEFQSLLDLYGESLSKIISLEDEISKLHSALQREAGPDNIRRSVVTSNRENQSSLGGILESTSNE